jgi:hypothetical protein
MVGLVVILALKKVGANPEGCPDAPPKCRGSGLVNNHRIVADLKTGFDSKVAWTYFILKFEPRNGWL